MPATARRLADAPAPAAPACNPLAAFAARGLRACWMPGRGHWSSSYDLRPGQEGNRSRPFHDVFYSLNVLLGFARAPGVRALEAAAGSLPDLPGTYARLCGMLPRLDAPRAYAHGMALWAGAALDVAVPGPVIDEARRRAADLSSAHAQDAAMLLSGFTALAAGDRAHAATADDLAGAILARFIAPSGLAYDAAGGPRRAYASFASQVYPAMALHAHGARAGDAAALAAADRIAATLIARQGPRGEWPWFYHAPSGRVVDAYEVYSVHQHGMGPAMLEHPIARGLPGAREAEARGLAWIHGANELGVSMLDPARGLILRSQVRAGELDGKLRRVVRAGLNGWLGREDAPGNHRGLVLRRECRSYELGWTLYAFGARDAAEVPGLAHPGLTTP